MLLIFCVLFLLNSQEHILGALCVKQPGHHRTVVICDPRVMLFYLFHLKFPHLYRKGIQLLQHYITLSTFKTQAICCPYDFRTNNLSPQYLGLSLFVIIC